MVINLYLILCKLFKIKDVEGAIYEISTLLTVSVSFYFFGLVMLFASQINPDLTIWGIMIVSVFMCFFLISTATK